MTNKAAFGIISAIYWLLGMHFFMHNPGGYGLYMPFNAWGWIFGSLVISLGLWRVTQQQRMVFSSLQTWLWIGALLLFMPMLYPGFEFRARAIPRLLGLGAGLLFLLAIYQWSFTRQARDKLLHLLLGAVAVEAVLGLVQFYLLTPGNWIGYDTRINRPYGIFQQPNVMATFMATGLALAIWLELRSEGRSWLRWLRCGVIVAASLLLAVLQSRVGQLSALLILLLLAAQMKQARKLGLILAGVTLGAAVGGLSLYESGNVTRGIEVYQSQGMRPVYWAYAAKLIAQAPWTGWGYGEFEPTLLYKYMAEKALHPEMVQIEFNLDHPHNEFLYWAVEGGVAPMLGLLLMAGALLRRVAQAGWIQGMGLLALLTPIALHTQTEFPLYHAVALWWALLLLVHLLDAEVEEQTRFKGQVTFRESVYQFKWLMRLGAVFLPAVVIPFMLTALHTGWVLTKFERGGRQDVGLLQTIVNPLAFLGRMENTVYTLRLVEGLQTLKKSELQAYLTWGENCVRHTPRARIYANMVLALRALERPDEARAMQARGLKVYPGDPSLIKAFAP